MDLMCLSKTIAVKQTSVHLSQTAINNMFLFCFCGIKSDSKRADFLCYQQILEARYVMKAGAYRIVVQSVLITRLRLQLSDISAQLWGLSWASRCTFYTKYYSYHKAILRSCTPNPFHHHLHILEAFSHGRQVRPMDGCPVFQTTPLLVMRTCKLQTFKAPQHWCLHSAVRTCFFQNFSLSLLYNWLTGLSMWFLCLQQFMLPTCIFCCQYISAIKHHLLQRQSAKKWCCRLSSWMR